MKNWIVICSLTLLSGCAGIGAVVTPVASVIGASASVCSAMDCLDKRNITVVLPECLWWRDHSMSEQSKAGMTREDKEWIVYLNLSAKKYCK